MCMISDGHYHTPCQHYTCKRTTEACAGAEGLIKPSITSFKGTCAPPAVPVEKEASGRGVVWIERGRSSGVVKPWVNTDVGSRVAVCHLITGTSSGHPNCPKETSPPPCSCAHTVQTHMRDWTPDSSYKKFTAPSLLFNSFFPLWLNWKRGRFYCLRCYLMYSGQEEIKNSIVR